MRNLELLLSKREIDYNRLITYGFQKKLDSYIFNIGILNGTFEVEIVISDKLKVSKVIDIENEEEYSLVDVETAVGEFVGSVRQEYEYILDDFANKCTYREVFKSKQSKEIIAYIKSKYGDELEFLWEKFDDNAIWRNKINNKWYGLLMILTEDKLGLKSDKSVEVLNVMCDKEKIKSVVDNEAVFPGYHMNKKSWISIKLDSTLKTEIVLDFIDKSYVLSLGKKGKTTDNDLSQKVYDYLTTIPSGKVVTYKQIAEHLGNKGLARAVGNILHKNPDEKKYPCYKVVNCKGELSGSFAFGGQDVQKQRLEHDGIQVIDNKVDLSVYQWNE